MPTRPRTLVQAGGVLLAQVRADELRARIVCGVLWLASALSVRSQLWLGAVVQVRLDRWPISGLFERVRLRGVPKLAALHRWAFELPQASVERAARSRTRWKASATRLLLPEGLMIA